jgi:hypothetical protein
MLSHERWKDREVLTTSGTYPWSFLSLRFLLGFLCRGLLLTRKQLNQVYPLGKLKSLLRKFYCVLHDFVNRYEWLRLEVIVRFVDVAMIRHKYLTWYCSKEMIEAGPHVVSITWVTILLGSKIRPFILKLQQHVTKIRYSNNTWK